MTSHQTQQGKMFQVCWTWEQNFLRILICRLTETETTSYSVGKDASFGSRLVYYHNKFFLLRCGKRNSSQPTDLCQRRLGFHSYWGKNAQFIKVVCRAFEWCILSTTYHIEWHIFCYAISRSSCSPLSCRSHFWLRSDQKYIFTDHRTKNLSCSR
jgi:hypothetical protein